MTPYAKEPKTNEEIADLLKVRGLVFDREELLTVLARIGYYRLKGYLVPFRKPQDVCFRDKTDFETVKAIYDFDSSLRTVLSEGLALIEVAVRALIIRYHLEVNPDPFAYTTEAGLPGLKPKAYAELMKHIGDAVAKAKMEPFMKHLAVEHGITSNPPPDSEWLGKSLSHIKTATPFVLRGMGFPSDWQKLRLWQ